MNFQNLNEDCVLHIFKFLSLNDLYAVCNVCTYFKKVVNNFQMKLCCDMTIDMPSNFIKIKDFLSCIGHHIETLKIVEKQRMHHSLSSMYNMTHLLQSYCLQLKHLRFEHFTGIRIIDFERHFNLETLELVNTSLCASLFKDDLKTTIKSLTLDSCTSVDINILLEYLQINDKISHLRLVNFCLCANESSNGLFNEDILTRLQNLQCLTIDYTVKCSNIHLIAKLDKLRKLFLLHFSEEKLTTLFEALGNKEQSQLQEVHFHMCTIINCRIYECLSKIKSLKVLEMCKNYGMQSEHLTILSNCKNLIHLRCFDCIQLVNDEGICDLVKHCDALRILEIYWCIGVTLETVDKIENINNLIGREYFTFKIGGRTGINWNDSGPIPRISKIDRHTGTFCFTADNENMACDTYRHTRTLWPNVTKDH